MLSISCSDEAPTSSELTLAEWESFGEANTSGLSFITEYINDNYPANGRANGDLPDELILAATNEYLKSEGISAEDRLDAGNYLSEILSNDEIPSYDGEITPMQATFIAALELALAQDVQFEEVISYIETLEGKASELLSEDEIGFVLMTTTTAKSQLTYWYENIDDHSGRTLCVKSWNQVGKKAIAGALGGAAACGVARFFGPVGWKVWGACILGGAVGTAVEDIVEQCLSPTNNQFTTAECIGNGGSVITCGSLIADYRVMQSSGVNPYILANIPQ